MNKQALFNFNWMKYVLTGIENALLILFLCIVPTEFTSNTLLYK